MAAKLRSPCVRCLASVVLPCLFFSSLLYLSTRHPLLEVAVREEVAAGRRRVFVARRGPSPAAAEANASAMTDKARASGIAAVAAEGGEGTVRTDEPLRSDDANVTAHEVPVSDTVAVATGNGVAKAVTMTDAPPESGAGVRRGNLRVPGGTAAAAAGNSTNGEEDTVVVDFRPFVFVYKSGRVHRFHGTETVPPGVDPATGVASMDVAGAGAGGVSARLYLPPRHRRGRKKRLAVLLYFHGGAFVIESPFSPLYHAFLNILVAKAGAVAVSVDYRLAPEHPLPAAYDDAWAALQWTVSSCRPSSGPGAAWLAAHGDASRIFLAGDSAGGNIAHNLAVRAGAERPLPGGAAIEGVLLLNPYFWGKAPVGSEPGEPWVREGLEKTWELVCGGRFGIDDPRVNPLAAPGAWRAMAGERVLVTIAGRDNFRDRAAAYAEGLRRCGWPGEVEVYVTEGEVHVHFVGNPRSDKAERETDKVAEFIAGRGRG